MYVETSALVASVLGQDPAMRRYIADTTPLVTSILTRMEAERIISRDVSLGKLDSVAARNARRGLRIFLNDAQLIEDDEVILARAGQPFPIEPVRSIDAVHLATLLYWGESTGGSQILTLDRRIRENAKALGYFVYPRA